MEKEIKRGQIYYADLEPILGSEQGGIRPVLIIQNDLGNQSSPTTIIAPITCQSKAGGNATHVDLRNHFLVPQSIALLEQIRTVDKRRLDRYVTFISATVMREIDYAIHHSLGLKCHEGGQAK
ncbi:MAG: type II toxin-antitoxin system PemK/MazF family toxin [Firmicutes bacterium]|nr:type II toxin-antitoxin system PemK/MazF family toxin [Bacillota bacterium]